MNPGKLPVPIFLLSLPRSGSTLLQRMLAVHPEIETVAEPNVLYYPLISLMEEGVYSLADHRYFLSAVSEFADQLPQGKRDYDQELGLFARRLYARSMSTPANYFLDKSPYYCFVAPHLSKLFEEAKFIFLWRHPLAVGASMLRYPGANPRQWSLYKYPHMFDGLANLILAYQSQQENSIALRYEELVQSPQETLSKILEYLGLPFRGDLAFEFNQVSFPGKHYDPNADRRGFQAIRRDRVNDWQQMFSNPLRKRWARHYLHWLGQERLEIMGYDMEEILSELSSIRTRRDFFLRDAYWMSFGFVFRLFSGRMLLNNMRKLRAGQRFWGYS